MTTQTLQRELQELSQANTGDTLEFFYRGDGEHACSDREARVVEVRSDGILGEDLQHEGGMRYFKNHEATDVKVLADTVTLETVTPLTEKVDFMTARALLVERNYHRDVVALLTGEQLASAYHTVIRADVHAVTFEDGYLIVQENPATTQIEIDHDGDIHFTAPNGAEFDIYSYQDQQTMGVTVSGANGRVVLDENPVTLATLSNQLAQFVLDNNA